MAKGITKEKRKGALIHTIRRIIVIIISYNIISEGQG